jgi:hypothetical protein
MEESLVHVLKTGRRLRRPKCDESATIAVDLGGTVEDSWESKRRWFAAKGFDLGPRPRSRHDVVQIIGGHAALYEQMAAEVYNDNNVLRRTPVPGVASALNVLSRHFNIVIVSSRVQRQRAITFEWLKRNRLAQFITDTALVGADVNKVAWCLRGGVSFLVDDDVRHLEPGATIPSLTRIHLSGEALDAFRMRDGILIAGRWRDIVAIATAPDLPRMLLQPFGRANEV